MLHRIVTKSLMHLSILHLLMYRHLSNRFQILPLPPFSLLVQAKAAAPSPERAYL
jgi:hypothetical protein